MHLRDRFGASDMAACHGNEAVRAAFDAFVDATHLNARVERTTSTKRRPARSEAKNEGRPEDEIDMHDDLLRHGSSVAEVCVKRRRQLEEKEESTRSNLFLDLKQEGQGPQFQVRDGLVAARAARFTDALPLGLYSGMLRYLPHLVNVVTLASVVPIEGSGTCLPLPLDLIAHRCTGAFFSPQRFAAVQLAFRTPRARVLIFRKLQCGRTHCVNAAPQKTSLLKMCYEFRRHGSSRRHGNLGYPLCACRNHAGM